MSTTIQDVVQRHLMVDIETLSTDPNAFITEFSAILFDPITGYVISCMTRCFDPWAEQRGSHIDGKTMQWRQQHPAQRLRWEGSSYYKLSDGLHDLFEFIEKEKPAKVWANDPTFDIAILNNAAKREFGRPVFTEFYKECSVRTAKFALEVARDEFIKLNNAHRSDHDCLNQIEVVTKFMDLIYDAKSGTNSSRPSTWRLSIGEFVSDTQREPSGPGETATNSKSASKDEAADDD